ncbi:hypothetical protein A2W13_00640 [Candidatus Woesebacteria bacterium RBG_16_36_11]|uniref:Type II secretion system protein GspG C-terminal domain-containing protein n=3 Tax=Candidatus Woeseibacteriota TaxID=1752722 RepID=A0A1F7X782_9BACT|nr:MAG: hypothetical protein A2Z67_01150 [Candidatus Woesebacteria bacterium RBG_13_36_22]OGM10936.1 MAG: hypothetical protein A2W13_00640 [Candidatus Woesebacteria bacterium RBG_16_36_11]OGM16906.1 MAG: hypothetical protein A2V55_03035 [Candidatus Woesebacteria bacterium RBG_19FT_COMBO_37_29]
MTAQKYLKRLGGFTLVELLIVIAILAIIALIVIAAINPIEQANRARDAGMKADSSQMVSAIDRYFAARMEFPWVTSGAVANNDAFYGFITAQDINIGICAADCNTDGILITTNELKPEFRNRNFITATSEDFFMYVGKAAEASSSVYACYIPQARANRDRACVDETVFTLSAVDGTRIAVPVADCTGAASTAWTANNWVVCVPE